MGYKRDERQDVWQPAEVTVAGWRGGKQLTNEPGGEKAVDMAATTCSEFASLDRRWQAHSKVCRPVESPARRIAALFATSVAFGVATLGLCVASGDKARAQQLAPQPWRAQSQGATVREAPAQSRRAPGKAQTRTQAKPSSAAASTAGGGDVGLRLQQMEEQIVDLQVVIGTVESLARSGAGRRSVGGGSSAFSSPAGLSGPDAGRIAALETQVQALTVQIEKMAAEIRGLRGGGASAGGGVSPPPSPPSSGWRPQVGGYNSNPGPAVRRDFASAPPQAGGDPIGNLITDGGIGRSPPPAPSPAAARQAYERAYGNLLQQDYRAAEAGFTAFLEQYPQDEMAANAQFWLGESHFVRGQWDAAAAAFLKVAQQHGRSAKAPDSLAKLAMALERKGNRNAACRALAELKARYPNPPAYVKTWESAERRRAGCA